MLIKIGSALINPEEVLAITPIGDEVLSERMRKPCICVILRHGGSFWTDATMDEAEAALIDAGVLTDLTVDPESDDPSLLLTDWEQEKLRELESDGYRFLARDKDGKLYAFRHKPKYGGFYWDDPDPAPALQVDGLSFISEDDDEPTDICRLLDY